MTAGRRGPAPCALTHQAHDPAALQQDLEAIFGTLRLTEEAIAQHALGSH